MKRIKNEGNPLAFGDPEIVASMIADAVSRPTVSEAELRNATKLGDALDCGDRDQAEEVVSRQVDLARKAYRKPQN